MAARADSAGVGQAPGGTWAVPTGNAPPVIAHVSHPAETFDHGRQLHQALCPLPSRCAGLGDPHVDHMHSAVLAHVSRAAPGDTGRRAHGAGHPACVRSSGLENSSGEVPQVIEDAARVHVTTRPVETGPTVLPAPGVVPSPGALESFEERTDGHQL